MSLHEEVILQKLMGKRLEKLNVLFLKRVEAYRKTGTVWEGIFLTSGNMQRTFVNTISTLMSLVSNFLS